MKTISGIRIRKTAIASYLIPLAIMPTMYLGACSDSASKTGSPQEISDPGYRNDSVTVELKDAKGAIKGSAIFTPVAGKSTLKISVALTGLPAGFHGVHVHEHGICTPDSNPVKNFVSAGKHFNLPANKGIIMSGNLIPVRINTDGTGETVEYTDAFTLKDLADAPGTAVVVHEKPDNFANIPPRYSSAGKPGPDATTIGTSDAGNRVLCGVIFPPQLINKSTKYN